MVRRIAIPPAGTRPSGLALSVLLAAACLVTVTPTRADGHDHGGHDFIGQRRAGRDSGPRIGVRRSHEPRHHQERSRPANGGSRREFGHRRADRERHDARAPDERHGHGGHPREWRGHRGRYRLRHGHTAYDRARHGPGDHIREWHGRGEHHRGRHDHEEHAGPWDGHAPRRVRSRRNDHDWYHHEWFFPGFHETGGWVYGWDDGLVGWWLSVAGAWYFYPDDAPTGQVIVEQTPPTPSDTGRPAPSPQYWYFCPAAKAYYPYVKQCPGGWQKVPARPSGQ